MDALICDMYQSLTIKQRQLLENTALKRFVEKSEVADSVLMMAEATGITGQALLVDNGALMI